MKLLVTESSFHLQSFILEQIHYGKINLTQKILISIEKKNFPKPLNNKQKVNDLICKIFHWNLYVWQGGITFDMSKDNEKEQRTGGEFL